jgi:hypothetical protein
MSHASHHAADVKKNMAIIMGPAANQPATNFSDVTGTGSTGKDVAVHANFGANVDTRRLDHARGAWST